MELTFGEQIKILLNRENRTITQFAELLEDRTGAHYSRQNVTQKLKRDNFQEQDMRLYAAVLGYKVQISLTPASQEEIADELAILSPLKGESLFESPNEDSSPDHSRQPLRTAQEGTAWAPDSAAKPAASSDTNDESKASPDSAAIPAASSHTDPGPAVSSGADAAPEASLEDRIRESARSFTSSFRKKSSQQPKQDSSSPAASSTPVQDLPPDCINPYSGGEYLANTVRKHPTLDRYIQVYDQTEHIWVDVAEDYFQKFQEQKRQLMGRDYTQPIYI